MKRKVPLATHEKPMRALKTPDMRETIRPVCWMRLGMLFAYGVKDKFVLGRRKKMKIQTQSKNGRVVTRSLKANSKLNSLFDIIVRTNGVKLTSKLRDAVSLKIGRVRQYAPEAFRARVLFERDHLKPTSDQFRVMVRYEVPGEDIVAERRTPEPLSGLDLVAETIERRLRKRKTARLASRVDRKARACRIADYCGYAVPRQQRR